MAEHAITARGGMPMTSAPLVPLLSPDASNDQSPPKRLTGIHVIPADYCYYPGAVQSADMLEVDFDARDPGSGLYLVEEHGPHGVTWMGCRRFDRRPLPTRSGGLWMDYTGEKDWRPVDLDAVGWRVVGRVCRVYRAQYA